MIIVQQQPKGEYTLGRPSKLNARMGEANKSLESSHCSIFVGAGICLDFILVFRVLLYYILFYLNMSRSSDSLSDNMDIKEESNDTRSLAEDINDIRSEMKRIVQEEIKELSS